MKIRMGFVSNSSSGSFILDKNKLTANQIDAIRGHMRYAQKHYPDMLYYEDNGEPNVGDAWRVEENPSVVRLRTNMDNFDMGYFLELIKVPVEAILQRGF